MTTLHTAAPKRLADTGLWATRLTGATAQFGALLRHAPLTVAFVAVLWIVGAATGSLRAGPSDALLQVVGVGPGALSAGQWWTPVSSALWCADLTGYLVTTVLLLTLVAPAEHRFGAAKTGLLLLITQIVGTLAGSALVAARVAGRRRMDRTIGRRGRRRRQPRRRRGRPGHDQQALDAMASPAPAADPAGPAAAGGLLRDPAGRAAAGCRAHRARCSGPCCSAGPRGPRPWSRPVPNAGSWSPWWWRRPRSARSSPPCPTPRSGRCRCCGTCCWPRRPTRPPCNRSAPTRPPWTTAGRVRAQLTALRRSARRS